MGAGILRRLTSVAVWGTLCVAFSVFTSMGAFKYAAVILVSLFGIIAAMLGPHFIVASWIIGSPTVFGFPNEILRALPFVTMERLMLGFLIVLVFLQYAFSKRQTPWLSVELTIVVFLIYALVSLSVHTDMIMYRKDGWLWIQFLMPMSCFIVSRRITWSENCLTRLLALLTLTGVMLAIIGILQSLFKINVFTMNYQTITAGHTGRAYGTFSNSHTFVATLSIFLTITLLQYSIYKDAVIRLLLIVAIGIIALGMFLGVSRAPWIGAALALVIIFVKHPQIRPLLLIGGGLAFFVGLVFFALTIDHLDGLVNRITNIGTLQGRAATWATAINMVVDQPLFGMGFGSETYSRYKPDYITGIGSLTAQYAVYLGVPHNQYLHVAVMLGVTGLILFLMILVLIVRLMFQVFRDPDEIGLRRHLGLYTGAIFIGLMFNSFFSDTYIQDYFWILAYFLAGVAAGGNLGFIRDKPRENQQGGRYIGPAS